MIRLGHTENALLKRINKMSGADVLECYQCGKCTASCPVADSMSVKPRQMMQYIKLGAEDVVLKANTSWFCLACSTCSARCPREIDIPHVMEAVRHLAMKKHVDCPDPDAQCIKQFHEIFMNLVNMYGRLFELHMMAEFNMRTLNPFKDIFLAPQVLLRGKLAFLPSTVKNVDAIRKMYVASEKLENELTAEEGKK